MIRAVSDPLARPDHRRAGRPHSLRARREPSRFRAIRGLRRPRFGRAGPSADAYVSDIVGPVTTRSSMKTSEIVKGTSAIALEVAAKHAADVDKQSRFP